MKLSLRNLTFEAFAIPLWGQAATEDVPQWLVDHLISGDLKMNSLGGLTSSCGATSCHGDVVIRAPDGSIGFVKRDALSQFSEVQSETLHQAA